MMQRLIYDFKTVFLNRKKKKRKNRESVSFQRIDVRL